MPNFDGTGPSGRGPLGWGMGPCGRGMRNGMGRGFGRRFNSNANTAVAQQELTKEEKVEMLSKEAELLKQQLKNIEESIKEIKG